MCQGRPCNKDGSFLVYPFVVMYIFMRGYMQTNWPVKTLSTLRIRVAKQRSTQMDEYKCSKLKIRSLNISKRTQRATLQLNTKSRIAAQFPDSKITTTPAKPPFLPPYLPHLH